MSSEAIATRPSQEKRYLTSTPWSQRSLRTKLAFWFAVLWTIYIILTMCRVFFYLDILIVPVAHRAICSGVLIGVCLLGWPIKKSYDFNKLPWYDIVMIVWALVACAYIAVNAEAFLEMWEDGKPFEIALFLGLFVAGLEAVRRTMGAAPSILAILFFFYFVYSNHFPGLFMSTGFTFARATGWLYFSGEGFWSTILGVATTIVPGFILFGAILQSTGAGEFFNQLALAVFGAYRGGPAKTAVFGSALMGMISGSAAANVATVGIITIPLMKKNGFKGHVAAAIEAVASTGGLFTPPVMGAVAFLIAQFLSLPYWQICLAAFLPAALFYIVMFYQIDIEAAHMNLKGMPRSDLPRVTDVLKSGWYYLLPLFALIFFLGYMRYTAETSILYTIILLIVCTGFSKRTRLNRERVVFVLEDTGRGLAGMIPMCMVIGVVVCSLTITGTGAGFSGALTTLAGGNIYLLLLMSAVASFILGMGLTGVACYLVVVSILAPAIVDTGILPLAAHLFLFFYGTISYFTPPVAIAAFVAAGIADCPPNAAGFQAMRFGIAAYLVPWVFIFKPELLFIGPLHFILFEFLCALTGMLLMVSGIRGMLGSRLGLINRILCVVLGLANIVPFPKAYELPILVVSLAYAAVLFILHKQRKRAMLPA